MPAPMVIPFPASASTFTLPTSITAAAMIIVPKKKNAFTPMVFLYRPSFLSPTRYTPKGTMMLKINAAAKVIWINSVMIEFLLVIFLVFLVFCFFDKRFKLSSVSFIEPAEQLIVFQTQNLNSHDQTFQSADEKVAKHDDNPVGISAGLYACQCQHHLHHGRVADSKGADTDKGKGIGKVT